MSIKKRDKRCEKINKEKKALYGRKKKKKQKNNRRNKKD